MCAGFPGRWAGYAGDMTTERGSGPRGDERDTGQDPDADPEMLQANRGSQPDQAEGADDRSETRPS